MSDRTSGAPSTSTNAASLDVVEFIYCDARPVRVVVVDHEPWFLADDVAGPIGRNIMTTVFHLPEHDKIQIDRSLTPALHGELRELLWLISLPGLCELAFRRGGADAREFARWVTHEVLPTVQARGLPSTARTDLPLALTQAQGVAIRQYKLKHPQPAKTDKRRARLPHVLYRFYDSKDKLLYVGVSCKTSGR